MRSNPTELPAFGGLPAGAGVLAGGRPDCGIWTRLASAFAAAAGLACGGAQAEPGSPVVVSSAQVRVEAQVREGRLIERYMARRGGEWIQVAASEDGATGATALVPAGQCVAAGKVERIGADGPGLAEEISVDGMRVRRRVSLDDNGPWIHVSTRLDPGRPAQLHSFVDRYRFPHVPDWSFAPSVGGFVPDAQYKAPLILVQADGLAFGIVPDVARLDRETLVQCNHALDLDVPAGPVLSVGFSPARLAYHSVYAPDEARSWRAESRLENAYYLLVTATAPPGGSAEFLYGLHWCQR